LKILCLTTQQLHTHARESTQARKHARVCTYTTHTHP